jgi:hypothetical protein
LPEQVRLKIIHMRLDLEELFHLTLLIGVAGHSNNQLNFPTHVVYDENTQILYIADEGNNRIMNYREM